jgi:hypothetical protein
MNSFFILAGISPRCGLETDLALILRTARQRPTAYDGKQTGLLPLATEQQQ